MSNNQPDKLNQKNVIKEKMADHNENISTDLKDQTVLSEEDIIQKYKAEAASKRKQDKTLLDKLRKKVKDLKKDDSNIYPLY